jgi:hypothetical protein
MSLISDKNETVHAHRSALLRKRWVTKYIRVSYDYTLRRLRQ